MVTLNDSYDGYLAALKLQDPNSTANVVANMRAKLGGPSAPRPQPQEQPPKPVVPGYAAGTSYVRDGEQLAPEVQLPNGAHYADLRGVPTYAITGVRDVTPPLPAAPAGPVPTLLGGVSALAKAAPFNIGTAGGLPTLQAAPVPNPGTVPDNNALDMFRAASGRMSPAQAVTQNVGGMADRLSPLDAYRVSAGRAPLPAMPAPMSNIGDGVPQQAGNAGMAVSEPPHAHVVAQHYASMHPDALDTALSGMNRRDAMALLQMIPKPQLSQEEQIAGQMRQLYDAELQQALIAAKGDQKAIGAAFSNWAKNSITLKQSQLGILNPAISGGASQ